MRNPSLPLICILLSVPCVAEAYIGPGAGLSAIGSFLALVGAVFLAIVGFVWFPLKRTLFRKKAQRKAEASSVAAGANTAPHTDDAARGVDRGSPGR